MSEMLQAGHAAYSELKNLCVWNKSNAGMGSFYRSKHELVFIWKNGTAPHINTFELGQHGRHRANVWDYPGISSLSPDRIDELAMHPTVKPVLQDAQYQQRPIPLEGNIIKREWLRYFKGDVPRQNGDYFVISWDTAMKSSELADYSVGTVWHVQDRGRKKNLVDVVRGRLEYPDLVTAAVTLWRKWKRDGCNTYLFIEDKGSGSSLIQSLRSGKIYVSPYKLKVEGDKVMRFTAQAAHFHGGSVHLRGDAPWVDDLVAELLGFPGVRHDDQVDSVSQALAAIERIEFHRVTHMEFRI
jgi:predicted phage terminase large subunit-like protein